MVVRPVHLCLFIWWLVERAPMFLSIRKGTLLHGCKLIVVPRWLLFIGFHLFNFHFDLRLCLEAPEILFTKPIDFPKRKEKKAVTNENKSCRSSSGKCKFLLYSCLSYLFLFLLIFRTICFFLFSEHTKIIFWDCL